MDLNISDAAATAEKAVEAVMRIEPMIAAGIGMLVPGASPVVATVQPMIVLAAPFVERALNALAAQNGGDVFAALLDLLNHISPGRPNAGALGAGPVAVAQDGLDASKMPVG
jgi:hypothetical protein